MLYLFIYEIILLEVATAIGTNLMEVSWDDTIFGRNSDIPLYI